MLIHLEMSVNLNRFSAAFTFLSNDTYHSSAMASRITLTRLASPSIASSSRLPWAPLRRSFPFIHPSPRSVTTLLSCAPDFRRPASNSTATAAATPIATSPDLPPIPPHPKVHVKAPSLAAIKAEGFLDDDVALIPESEASLVITPEAIRVKSFSLLA